MCDAVLCVKVTNSEGKVNEVNVPKRRYLVIVCTKIVGKMHCFVYPAQNEDDDEDEEKLMANFEMVQLHS